MATEALEINVGGYFIGQMLMGKALKGILKH